MFGTYKVKIDNNEVGIIKVNKLVRDKLILIKEKTKMNVGGNYAKSK